MKTLILIALLSFTSNFAIAECTEYMQAFNKHQLVIKGMMDLNFQRKMNAEVADAIGKRLQEAQLPLDAGDYNKACKMYDSIIDEYGFDKSFGETPDPEKKKQNRPLKVQISQMTNPVRSQPLIQQREGRLQTSPSLQMIKS